jgi:hypothetical protein
MLVEVYNIVHSYVPALPVTRDQYVFPLHVYVFIRGGYRAGSVRLDRARAGSLRKRAGSARLVKQPSQRTSSARLVCELELARLAREPQQKIVYMYIYNNIINY